MMDDCPEDSGLTSCEFASITSLTQSANLTQSSLENPNVNTPMNGCSSTEPFNREEPISDSKELSSDSVTESHQSTSYHVMHSESNASINVQTDVTEMDYPNDDTLENEVKSALKFSPPVDMFERSSSEENLYHNIPQDTSEHKAGSSEIKNSEQHSKGDGISSSKKPDNTEVSSVPAELDQDDSPTVESNRKRKMDEDNDDEFNSYGDERRMETEEAVDNESISDFEFKKSSEDENEEDKAAMEKKKLDKLEDEKLWLNKDISDLSKPRWKSVLELRKRQTLSYSRYWPCKVCGARGMVKRFKLQNELVKHSGCVNALHFNQRGTLLASGSDDLKIMLWDWANNCHKPVVSYESGHKSNVFQAKFLPNSGDATVVSSARDGQVRVGNISTTGTCKGTKKVAQHRGSVHKIALDVERPSTFYSCGEDGTVFQIDLRRDKTTEKVVTVKVDNHKLALYSIHVNPTRPYEFAVSGKDIYARVYDRRMLNETDGNTEPVKLFCPHHLQEASANITCLVYNWDGSELLCSYNDDDIYLFDASHSSGADYIKRYKGHRNSATVKGVNFYGPRSQFIVSGSDCGNIFYWDKESSRIVTVMDGDVGGVVNVLEPHPNLPVIATSGLDHEVKIWTPTSDPNDSSQLDDLKSLMLSNLRQRDDDRHHEPDMVDSHMLWFLMHTLRNRRRRINLEAGEDTDSDDLDSSSNSSDSSGDSEDSRAMRCIQS